MKRPLFWAGMVCLCASSILCLLGEEWLFAALSLSFLLGMLALMLHRASPHLFAAAAGVLLACAGHWVYLQHSVRPMQALTGQTRQFSGYVVSVANWDNRTEYLLAGRVEGAGSRILTLRLVTFQEDLEWQICQPLAGEVKLVGAKEQYRTRQRVQGINSDIRLGQGGLTAPKVEPPKGWSYYTALLRLRLGEQIARFIPRNAPLVSQMLFSQEATIPSETFDQMAKAGVAHVLVVSGQHLAIALQGVLLLAGVLRLKKWMTALLGGCTVLLVGLMAGFAPSISRAAVMSLIMLGATLFDRENDPLTALGVSAILLCLTDPYEAISQGVALSYGATLSILLFYRPVYGWLREAAQSPRPLMDKLLRWVQGAVALWAASQILITPVAALFFGYLPTYGLLFNLILTPVVPVLLVGAWSMGIMGLSGLQALPALLENGMDALGSFTIALTRWAAGLPFAAIPIRSWPVILWLFFAAGCLVLLRHRKVGKALPICLCASLLPLFVWGAVHSAGYSRALCVSAQKGGSVVLSRAGAAVVVDLPEHLRGVEEAAVHAGGSRIDGITASSAKEGQAARIQALRQLAPQAAVLPEAALTEAGHRLEHITTATAEGSQLFALGCAKLTVYPHKTLIEAGGVKLLKLTRGYDILFSSEEAQLWEGLDAIISPEGKIAVLNPALRIYTDPWGAQILYLRAEGS